ncbi:MAG: DUF2807 domain-containing protein [Muribaculaceae bacterium]|nr:DUF2807 domain-containing protein [Muribaculaceae bacterium]
MMKQVMRLAFLAVMGMTMMSCNGVQISGINGVDKTPTQVQAVNQVTTMEPFDEVEIGGGFKIVYEQGAEHSVRIEANEQAFKEMTVYVKDRELRIRKAVANPTESQKNVKVYVTSPVLKMIDLAGSGMFAATNPINVGNDLDIDVAGSGQVLLTAVTCHDSDLDIAGSGNIEIGQFKVNDVEADIAGSGDINLGKMECKELQIDIAGSGNVNCDNIIADQVHSEIAGSGNVNLKGSIKNHTKDVAGSGKVNYTEATAPDTIQ